VLYEGVCAICRCLCCMQGSVLCVVVCVVCNSLCCMQVIALFAGVCMQVFVLCAGVRAGDAGVQGGRGGSWSRGPS
jgi:hypothetical protein